MTEADLQAQAVELAEILGLVALHVRQPRTEGGEWKGFPDLLIIAPGGGIMFRELKMPGKQLRAPQRDWAAILAGQDHGVWKPHDWHSGRVRAQLEALAGRAVPVTGPPTAQDRLWRAAAQAAERDRTQW
jgi:hypothetical protein